MEYRIESHMWPALFVYRRAIEEGGEAAGEEFISKHADKLFPNFRKIAAQFLRECRVFDGLREFAFAVRTLGKDGGDAVVAHYEQEFPDFRARAESFVAPSNMSDEMIAAIKEYGQTIRAGKDGDVLLAAGVARFGEDFEKWCAALNAIRAGELERLKQDGAFDDVVDK